MVYHATSHEVAVPLGPPRQRVVVIGAGFAGLSTACYLAKEGFQVTVVDALPGVGGRCRTWEKDGFIFDMGPSWYWMPDVFDDFFAHFGKKTSDYFKLTRLDPSRSYRLFMEGGRRVDIPDSRRDLEELFESVEPGAREKFRQFMHQAEYKYKIAMSDYVKRPSLQLWEFFDARLAIEAFRLDMFKSQASHVRSYFKHPDLISIMEWPVLFLGGAPTSVPAMYSLMNYAAIQLGTWYPEGGMVEVPKAMQSLAKELGVEFHCGEQYEAKSIVVEDGKATGVQTHAGFFGAEYVVGTGDYHHIEQDLLDKQHRVHTEEQWDRYTLSPSSLLFYLGVSKKLKNLRHHNLFFDADLELHAQEIYQTPKWPSRPLFYVCIQSATDLGTAPANCENVFVLIPLAAGLKDSEEMRDRYYEIVMERLERHTGQSVRDSVVVKRAYAMRDFEQDYKSYKGNAYGLANTLLQTAVFKPPAKSAKVDNLYFAGQLTVPGPGVPPSLISGGIVAKLIARHREKGFGVRVGCIEKSKIPFLVAAICLILVLLFVLSLGNLRV